MSWKDAQVWERLKSGADCPMCSDEIYLEENAYGFKVADLPTSVVRLSRNQFHRGWTVVILRRHACELHELTAEEISGFWRDVALASNALQTVFHPVKLNYCVFGHLVPHIHCHLLCRFAEDDPHAPVELQDGERFLSADEYRSVVAELQEAIGVTA